MRRSGSGLFAGLFLAVFGALACTFSRDFTVLPHRLQKPLPMGLVNSFNVEEQLQRGYIPEVTEFLASAGGRSLDAVRFDRLSGQVLLERGDFRGAAPRLERALAGTGRASDRAELAWLLSQGAYWDGEFSAAGRWGRVAQREGKPVPDGWLVFLESQGTRAPYGGASAGERLALPVDFGRPNLLRLAVRVNGRAPEEMVLDSGASLSLLTESAAARLGVTFVPGANASAKGLHATDVPMRLGWVDSVRLGEVTLTDVPVGVLPDGTLTFETTSSGVFRLNGVLGAHFMKEFDWRIAYVNRLVQARRLDRRVVRGSKDQNLFFRRMKPMARASLNGQPWSLFLLDTGSEPSMITRGGLLKTRLYETGAAYPVTLEGIGKSRVSWAKISNVTVGVGAYMVRFKDIVLKEEGDGIEDGILGASFLSPFNVEIHFGAMTLVLENPLERHLREVNATSRETAR
ncbi:MAG: aspartyl protease family protein [Thermoanaerobaculia bacterium]|nr:aspartyl protease family protein [Thermoanaerobaculia bacterium]